MCSQFATTVKDGFLSTTNFPNWVPKTDENCSCWLQPLGGDITVQVVQFYYNQGAGESYNGFNLTARWGLEWPNRISGGSHGRYMNYTLVQRTIETVHLQLLNEGVSIGRLWLHFKGKNIFLFYKAKKKNVMKSDHLPKLRNGKIISTVLAVQYYQKSNVI